MPERPKVGCDRRIMIEATCRVAAEPARTPNARNPAGADAWMAIPSWSIRIEKVSDNVPFFGPVRLRDQPIEHVGFGKRVALPSLEGLYEG